MNIAQRKRIERFRDVPREVIEKITSTHVCRSERSQSIFKWEYNMLLYANIQNKQHALPIIYAIRDNDVWLVLRLIEHGADPSEFCFCTSTYPLTLLVDAIDINKELVSLLLDNGADPNGEPIQKAIDCNNLDFVKMALKRGKVNFSEKVYFYVTNIDELRLGMWYEKAANVKWVSLLEYLEHVKDIRPEFRDLFLLHININRITIIQKIIKKYIYRIGGPMEKKLKEEFEKHLKMIN